LDGELAMNVDALKSGLEDRLAELTEKIGEIDGALRQADSADSEERATENEDDEVLEDMGNAALVEINQIKAALTRIELGTYGECTHCGTVIDEKRLTAVPFAAHCIECEASAEA
jgi:RNA polymerase-binding transcription factor DksA